MPWGSFSLSVMEGSEFGRPKKMDELLLRELATLRLLLRDLERPLTDVLVGEMYSSWSRS